MRTGSGSLFQLLAWRFIQDHKAVGSGVMKVIHRGQRSLYSLDVKNRSTVSAVLELTSDVYVRFRLSTRVDHLSPLASHRRNYFLASRLSRRWSSQSDRYQRCERTTARVNSLPARSLTYSLQSTRGPRSINLILEVLRLCRRTVR